MEPKKMILSYFHVFALNSINYQGIKQERVKRLGSTGEEYKGRKCRHNGIVEITWGDHLSIY